ncbi:hypothetical protein LINGRAHAP2_LOCUS31145, partial [Linum grandiflorum]
KKTKNKNHPNQLAHPTNKQHPKTTKHGTNNKTNPQKLQKTQLTISTIKTPLNSWLPNALHIRRNKRIERYSRCVGLVGWGLKHGIV